MEQAKPQTITDLLHAHVPIPDIMNVVGCARSTIYEVKKRLYDNDILSRLTKSLAPKITEDPTVSMKKLAEAPETRPC